VGASRRSSERQVGLELEHREGGSQIRLPRELSKWADLRRRRSLASKSVKSLCFSEHHNGDEEKKREAGDAFDDCPTARLSASSSSSNGRPKRHRAPPSSAVPRNRTGST
jgi:hypothetical protein